MLRFRTIVVLPFQTSNTGIPAIGLSAETGAEIRFSIVAWSRELGRGQALEVVQSVIALLHDQPLVLDGHLLINLRHTTTETTRGDATSGRRALARFRAVTEPLPS